MGRFYHGDISGKFWFTIQSSSDADWFGVEGNPSYRFFVCGCSVDIDKVSEKSNIYCEDCYTLYEYHKADRLKEEMDEIDERYLNYEDLYYEEDNIILYDFKSEHIETVENKVQELETQYGKYILKYEITDDEGECTYDVEYDHRIEDNHCLLEYIARLCLGKQILYCLHTYGKCFFEAEY